MSRSKRQRKNRASRRVAKPRDQTVSSISVESRSSVTDIVEPAENKEPETVHLTAVMLEQFGHVFERFDQLDESLANATVPSQHSYSPVNQPRGQAAEAETELLEDIQRLQAELDSAWRNNEELRSQNEDLASQLAHGSVQETVDSGHEGDESLSWDDRKALVLQQLEDECFEPEQFLQSLSESAHEHLEVEGDGDDATEAGKEDSYPGWPSTPLELIDYFEQELEHHKSQLADRDTEINELKILLQQQSETRDGGVAIGAAAIASMIDGDELVMQERQRLQQLKNEWEDKFRQAEIEASLERAKLSRERQAIARRAEELEEQFARLSREKRDLGDSPAQGRRWLAELGLASDSN